MLGQCSTDGVPRELWHIGVECFRRVRDVDDYWLPPSCFTQTSVRGMLRTPRLDGNGFGREIGSAPRLSQKLATPISGDRCQNAKKWNSDPVGDEPRGEIRKAPCLTICFSATWSLQG